MVDIHKVTWLRCVRARLVTRPAKHCLAQLARLKLLQACCQPVDNCQCQQLVPTVNPNLCGEKAQKSMATYISLPSQENLYRHRWPGKGGRGGRERERERERERGPDGASLCLAKSGSEHSRCLSQKSMARQNCAIYPCLHTFFWYIYIRFGTKLNWREAREEVELGLQTKVSMFRKHTVNFGNFNFLSTAGWFIKSN